MENWDDLPLQSDDRRVFERFDARFPAKIKDSREDFGWSTFIRDASAQGAKLTTRDQMYLNDSVSLEIKLPDGKEPMTMRGQVVWKKNIEPNVWDVGVRFHKISLMHMSRMFQLVEGPAV